MQTLFTKQSPNAQYLAFQDMCRGLLKQSEDLRLGTRFIMKQFLIDSSQAGLRALHMRKQLEKVNQENTQLKQAHNAQRMRLEQVITELQQKLDTAQNKLDEKERQLMQFRKIHGSMTPEVPTRDLAMTQGAEPRRVSVGEMQQASQSGRGLEPPLKGFMMQRQANEIAKQRALEEPTKRNLFLSGPSHANHPQNGGIRPRSQESYSTPMNPIHLQHRPYSTDSGGSAGVGRIRDFSSGSGFPFAGNGGMQPNKRPRGQSPTGRICSGMYSAPRGMSPSQAFALQGSNGPGMVRGPTTYFQQSGYDRR